MNRFGSNARKTMISNESISELGPGPAAYNHLRSLKNVVVQRAKFGPVIRPPHELDARVKKKLNVSSSEDFFKQKQDLPGPGYYEPDTSQFDTVTAPQDSTIRQSLNDSLRKK